MICLAGLWCPSPEIAFRLRYVEESPISVSIYLLIEYVPWIPIMFVLRPYFAASRLSTILDQG